MSIYLYNNKVGGGRGRGQCIANSKGLAKGAWPFRSITYRCLGQRATIPNTRTVSGEWL